MANCSPSEAGRVCWLAAPGRRADGSSAALGGGYAGCQERPLMLLGLLPGMLSGASRPPAAGTV
jgi:hypothetical protein